MYIQYASYSKIDEKEKKLNNVPGVLDASGAKENGKKKIWLLDAALLYRVSCIYTESDTYCKND